ncbi:uncharacterized protein LOC106182108 [Lingula anatina]|uniref:Uncharacterized protein LOC106182108 n=1 Tax=Lingula anatina TaxID=7574 RepID=A0A1S3KHV6_LINAN|nr:uncharacterized protein LOC106182108 [Lingula anatina]|eukprot:XP_013422213.1 uncharacterized protein LOC106182108 [Lingula anatina]
MKVLEAWDEPTSTHPQGQHGNSSLHYEGRAAELTITRANPADIQELARLAKCVGFDHVRRERDQIKVCVLPQKGDFDEIVSLPKVQLRVVKAPPVDEHQYAIPEELAGESRIPKLFDGWNKSQPVSEHFTIQDFLCPRGQQSYYRYFRLEVKIVECLEQLIIDFNEDVLLVKGSGYRVRSVNLIDIDNRHPNEKRRFQMGQAVEIALQDGSRKSIPELWQQVVRSCLPLLTFDQLGLNIGIHPDRVYVDIHPLSTSHTGMPLHMWTGNGKHIRAIDDMEAFYNQILKGGPIIVPRLPEHACRTPTFGEDLFYISVQLDSTRPGCNSARSSSFCEKSKPYRERELSALLRKVNAALGSRKLETRNVQDCFVNACGKCKGSGWVWEKKVRSCLAFLSEFISKTSTPFRDMHNKAAFFNTENPNSTVHHLSCNQMVCLENTVLHGILVDTVTATFRPYKNDIEMRLYSGAENPSPIMDLLEQVMAMRASGHVRVYIERNNDLSALHNVIKILLVHNSKVANVTFHVTPDAHKDYINEGLQRKIETWAGLACPTRSRVAISPFTVEELPHHRVRRSLENSKARNDMKRDLHHWELNWLMRN